MSRIRSLVVGVLCTACIAVSAREELAGKSQGETPSGRPVVLELNIERRRLTGTLTVGQQSSEISEGQVEGKTFSFKATVEGRTTTFDGRLVGEDLHLSPQRGPGPVALKRVK